MIIRAYTYFLAKVLLFFETTKNINKNKRKQAFSCLSCLHLPPFVSTLSSHAEHRHIEYVGLLGIDDAGLCRCHLLWHQVALDGIGVYAVVDFRQLPLRRPAQQLLLLSLQPLELLYKTQLELW